MLTASLVVLSFATLVWFGCGFVGAGIDLAIDVRYQPVPLLHYKDQVQRRGFIRNVLRGPRTLWRGPMTLFRFAPEGFLVPGRACYREVMRRQREEYRRYRNREGHRYTIRPFMPKEA